VNTTVLIISLATFVSTLGGGLFALRFRERLHWILGFSGGALLGVALFDLVPEAISLAAGNFSVAATMGVLAAGFFGYMLLDRAMPLHGHGDATPARQTVPERRLAPEPAARRGVLGAGSLTLHSFLDGFSIGLAFKVGAAVGAVVAIAVLVHDFSDGINTVGLILRNRGSGRSALRWLIADALAPVLGAACTLWLTVQRPTLGLTLAAFAGVFLYIGASNLVPESYHQHPSPLTTLMTILGALTILIAIRLAGG